MLKGFGALFDNNAIDFIQPHEQWDHYTPNNLLDVLDDQPSQEIMGCFQNDLDYEISDQYNRPKKTARVESNNSPRWCHDEELGNAEEEGEKEENERVSLMTLLMESAVAISNDDLNEANRRLIELNQMVSPYASSCAERVVAYFAKAMSSRVMNSWLGMFSPLMVSRHKAVAMHSCFQAFNNVAPFIKFAHFTSNQAILESFHRFDRVHIIDLDIMQGLQWPALFHILATRIEGPPHVRMTGFGKSIELLIDTGKQLSNFAKRLGMSFEFYPIHGKRFGDMEDPISELKIQKHEAVAVHWYQHCLYDSIGPNYKAMRLLQEISPKVITLVEQEIAHRGSFLDRFVSSLHFYSTIFDSLGAHLANDDPNRHRVEHGLLYREIHNVLAIGGPARSGEEKFMMQWRNELLKNGFVQLPMSTNSMAQAQLILNMFPPPYGYSLVQGEGTLRLGWKHTSLYSISAWTSRPPAF